MKLTELREELTARADSTDTTADLLPGVRRKIARTKRRRAALAAAGTGCVAVVAAVASGIIPGTTAPQPAEETPRDYQKDGLYLPAFQGADRLEKGWIGDAGENTIRFSWVPEGGATRFAPVCTSAAGSPRFLTVEVNGYIAGHDSCVSDPPSDQPGSGIGVLANSPLWLMAPAGKPAQVVVRLSDENGRALDDATAQIALGIYRTADEPSGPPVRAVATSPTDYVKDGIRYRAKIGGDTLLGAKIADRGASSFEFGFTAPGGPISLNQFCTPRSAGADPKYQLSVTFNGLRVGEISCSADSTDAGIGGSWIPGVKPPAGRPVKVVVRLEDTSGRPVSRPKDWIGLGIYAKGEQRTVDTTNLDELIEYGGHDYRLTTLRTAPQSGTDHLELATPADTPFLLSYGSTGPSDGKTIVSLTGLGEGSSGGASGIGTAAEAARPAATAKITIDNPHPPTGHLVIALYLPAD